MSTQTFAANDPAVNCTTALGGTGFTFVPANTVLDLYFTGVSCALNVYPNETAAQTASVSVDGGFAETVSMGPTGSFNVTSVAAGLPDALHSLRVTFGGVSALDGPALVSVTGAAPSLTASKVSVSGSDPSISYFGTAAPESNYAFRAGEFVLDIVGTGFSFLAYRGGGDCYVSVDGVETQLANTNSDWTTYIAFTGAAPGSRHTVAVRTASGWAFRTDATFGAAFGLGASVQPSTLARVAPRSAQGDGPAQLTALDGSLSFRFSGTDVAALVPGRAVAYCAVVDGQVFAPATAPSANGDIAWLTLASGLPAGPHDVQVFGVFSGDYKPVLYAVRGTGGAATLSPPVARKKALFGGDSLSNSINAGVTRPDSTTGFCFRLSAEMRLSAVNLGNPGYTTAQERAVMQAYCAAVAAGTADAPDLINVLLGHNDITTGVSVASWTAEMTGLLSDLTTAFPSAKILCHEIVRGSDGQGAAAYNAALPGIVSAAGANVSLYRDALYADPSTELLGDFIHLSDAGCAAFVRRWAPEFRRLLGLDYRRRRSLAGVG